MNENHIYLSKIDLTLSQDIYDGLLQIISKENRERCLRFRHKEDSLRTLYGELIVRYALCREFAVRNEEIEFIKSDDGKPYVKGVPVYFNVSHAGDFVVCAFSEHEVGVDIERVRDVDLKLARRYFCECECEDLFAQDADRRIDYFFSLWTLKESYMKWLGRGLSVPLDSFFFKISDDGISVTDVNRATVPFFKQFFVEGYKLSVCSTVDDFPDEMEEIIWDFCRRTELGVAYEENCNN